jgi:predicted  nucleic acid-binding Zn-ribbon protein
MASASVKQPCIKCDKGFGRNMCSGCQQWFCNKHYNQHQEELAKEMENVTQKHDELHSHLTMESMGSEHPLLVRINEWEQRSIDRIRAVTNEARTKLKQSLDQVKQEIKTSLSQVADQLKSSRENEDYTEIDLKIWMNKLESLKQHLLNPPEIELHGDTQAETNASTIKLIGVKAPRIVSRLMRITPLTLHRV